MKYTLIGHKGDDGLLRYMKTITHPVQSVVFDKHGVARFKANEIEWNENGFSDTIDEIVTLFRVGTN